MSVESLVIAELVAEGSPKKALQLGITDDDFEIYDEEFAWLLERAERQKPINPRLFKQAFSDFEFIRPHERVEDLIDELKQERAYLAVASAIDEISQDLTGENAMEKAAQLREILGDTLRIHNPASDVLLKADWESHWAEMKRLKKLHDSGHELGISTGIKSLDHHLGGLVPGRMIVTLGRPGDAKSYLIAKFAVEAMKQGKLVGLFSPEMSEFEHRCRVHTLLSADPKIQKDCDLTQAFRNRALMEGHGFDMKRYKRFLKYINGDMKGEIFLFTQRFRRVKMNAGYVEQKIEDFGLDLVIVDPIYKLRPPRKRALRHEELADIVDSMQELAESFNVPIVITNQAHRLQGNARGNAPHKDTSFGSDSLAQEGDHVIGVKHIDDEGRLILRCTKNRFGGNFQSDIRFRPNIGLMEDLTPINDDAYFNGSDDDKTPEDIKEIIGEAHGHGSAKNDHSSEVEKSG